MGKKLVPNYEVKLLMLPEAVLKKDDDGNLTSELKKDILKEFNIDKDDPAKNMSIQFIDTKDQVIQKDDWNLRIRRSDDSKENNMFGLTYKKRVKILVDEHPDPVKNIEIAVQKAAQQGFDFDESAGFEPQVEVGYKAQTLSISYNNDDISADKYQGMFLPEAKESIEYLLDKMPPQFKNWTTVSAKGSSSGGPLDGAIVYGPVHAKRYAGKRDKDGKKKDKSNRLYIEVWPIRTSRDNSKMELVVEASFKVDEAKDAIAGKDELAKRLDKNGWFKDIDSLKTSMIMNNYPANS